MLLTLHRPSEESRLIGELVKLLHVSVSRCFNVAQQCSAVCSETAATASVNNKFGTSETYSHVANIVLTTLISDLFSIAAATLSLSPSCLFTSFADVDVPSLMRTSTLMRGGSACTNRTSTPNPMTVVSEHAEVVGVRRTVTVLMRERGEVGGMIEISSSFTTPNDPKDRGCSGSEMVEIRSYTSCSSISSRISSESESDEDDASGEEKGSARLGYAAAKASNIPGCFAVGADLRREGKSEGLRMVGLALSLFSGSMLLYVSGADARPDVTVQSGIIKVQYSTAEILEVGWNARAPVRPLNERRVCCRKIP